MSGTPNSFASHFERTGNEVTNPKVDNSEKQAPSVDKLWGDLKNLLDEKKPLQRLETVDEVDNNSTLREAEADPANSEKEFNIGELIKAAVEAGCDELVEATSGEDTADALENVGLTDEEKKLIKEETGWSDEIIERIKSMDQYAIYKNADLHEAEINGRKCLLKDVDLDYVDPKTGMTNRELMAKGRSPIDSKTREKIELHHMGQDPRGPFAELCENSEHGDGKHGILHTKFEDSWRNNSDLNNQYQIEKRNHWKTRAQED